MIILILEDLVMALCCPPLYVCSHFSQQLWTWQASDLERGCRKSSPQLGFYYKLPWKPLWVAKKILAIFYFFNWLLSHINNCYTGKSCKNNTRHNPVNHILSMKLWCKMRAVPVIILKRKHTHASSLLCLVTEDRHVLYIVRCCRKWEATSVSVCVCCVF